MAVLRGFRPRHLVCDSRAGVPVRRKHVLRFTRERSPKTLHGRTRGGDWAHVTDGQPAGLLHSTGATKQFSCVHAFATPPLLVLVGGR